MSGTPLAVAVDAALAAGRIQRERADRVGTIQYKGERDPVTEIDLLCEQEVIGRIQKAFPGHAFLAEESGATKGDADHLWIIDPLDGTTNYAHGFPRFAVSIGVEYRDERCVGIVYDPLLDELFSATRGGGAFLGGRRLEVSTETQLGRALVATGFAYDIHKSPDDNIASFARVLKTVRGLRRDGSAALDLCYVAAGRFDGFWELKLHPWDVAAGIIIVEEAGGRTSDFTGAESCRTGRETVVSNKHLHDAMLEILRH